MSQTSTMSVELLTKPASIAEAPPAVTEVPQEKTSATQEIPLTITGMPLLHEAINPMLQRFVDAATATPDAYTEKDKVGERLLFSVQSRRIVRPGDVASGRAKILHSRIALYVGMDHKYIVDSPHDKPLTPVFHELQTTTPTTRRVST